MARAVLIRASDAFIQFGPFDVERPTRVHTPDEVSVSPAFIGWASPDGAWRIVEYVEQGFARPGPYYHDGGTASDLAGNVLTVTKTWVAWTQAEIDAEIARRVEEEVDDVVSRRLGKVLYELAKATRPTLTPAQFRNWVKSL